MKGRPPKLTLRFLALCADGVPRTTAEITALLAHDTKTNVSKFLMDLYLDLRMNPLKHPGFALTTKKHRPGVSAYRGGPKRVWVLVCANANQQQAA
jgi:hypothetical protein